MGKPQLSLASLMGLIAVIALGITGVISASSFWTSAAATATLGLLLAAVLGAFLLRDAEHAFCLGFALFGVVYLVLVDWDWVGGPLGHDLTAGLRDAADQILPTPAIASSASASGVPFRSPSKAWPPGRSAWATLSRSAGWHWQSASHGLAHSWDAGSTSAGVPGQQSVHRRPRTLAPTGRQLSERPSAAGSCTVRSTRRSGFPTGSAAPASSAR